MKLIMCLVRLGLVELISLRFMGGYESVLQDV